jgi:hypothetical protein
MTKVMVSTDNSTLEDRVVSDYHWAAFVTTEALDAYFGNTTDSSSESLDYEERKARLLAIIDGMKAGAPSWDGEPARVSEGSAETGKRFLKALPFNRELPKVSPDGEGDLLFVWEPPQGNCVVTIQDRILHVVEQPGTRSVEHIDNQPFTGRRLPVSILPAIPLR